MGRAINMENELAALEIRVKKVEETLSIMIDTASTKKNINLIEGTKNGKEKANNERDDSGGKQPNKRAKSSKKSSS